MIAYATPTLAVPIRIWLVGVSFVLFQFFLQLSSGTIIDAIGNEMHFSAFHAGLLSSMFYYVYTILQIPVGYFFDKYDTRLLLSLNALLCSLGCFLFAHSYHFSELLITRFLIGAGSSFAFIGASHILRTHFPPKKFAFFIGFSETLAFLVTVISLFIMSYLLHKFGWRVFINIASMVGLIISLLCWYNIPSNNKKIQDSSINYKLFFISLFNNKKIWINGIFVGLSFIIITTFAAMWAVPFLQIKLNCSLQEATNINAMLFLGTGISCPLIGKLSTYSQSRRLLMFLSCYITACLLLIAFYLPVQKVWIMGVLMFFIGLCSGGYMLAYSISNELAPAGYLSTYTGFTNTFAVLTAPIFQPIIGYWIDKLSHKSQGITLADYQNALLLVPICLLIAGLLVFFLPKKKLEEAPEVLTS